MVGAVGIEIASRISKTHRNKALPAAPKVNCCQMLPNPVVGLESPKSLRDIRLGPCAPSTPGLNAHSSHGQRFVDVAALLVASNGSAACVRFLNEVVAVVGEDARARG
jgi:hypothetical protein